MSRSGDDPEGPCRSFPPLLGVAPRVLILGSMPGERSLAAGEYYAHPRNAFWPIVDALLGIDAGMRYAERTRALACRGVAVWDVLAECKRRGSLDSAIDPATLRANPLERLISDNRQLRLVAFNGQTAAKLFARLVGPRLEKSTPEFYTFPSTSPAHASLDLDRKIEVWRRILDYLD